MANPSSTPSGEPDIGHLEPCIERLYETMDYSPIILAVLTVEEIARPDEHPMVSVLPEDDWIRSGHQRIYLVSMTDGQYEVKGVYTPYGFPPPIKDTAIRLLDYRLEETRDGSIFLVIKDLAQGGRIRWDLSDGLEIEDEPPAQDGEQPSGQTRRGQVQPPSAPVPPGDGAFVAGSHAMLPPSAVTPPLVLGRQAVTRPLNLWTLNDLITKKRKVGNYMCDVLGLVVECSPVRQSRLGPKRDLRIIDHTIPDGFRGRPGVMLSTFVDVPTFAPAIGTLGLFRGLKTHAYEETSLNSYPTENEGKLWFVTGEEQLTALGADVAARLDAMNRLQHHILSRHA
ncbi:hypothetical protein KEM52_001424 [Ascosphaera acerosa]|nr:hypothetical protein KEM52_001424 [Ascosphaera acerosa]